MKDRFKITVDIYRNHFNAPENYPYLFDNLKAVNLNEQEAVNEIINKMIANGSPQLFEPDLHILSSLKPIETNRICFLNPETLQIEFK